MSTTEIAEAPVDKSNVSVKTFFDPTKKNMGLEKYELVLFDGVSQGEQIMCLERNGVKEYITGLNEFAPSVQNIADPEKKDAVIKSIREKVVFLEMLLAQNKLDPKQKDFWEKVKLIRNDNSEFWDKVSIAVSNQPLHLDPKKPMDLILITAIEAGGFTLVAKSLDDARSRRVPVKFYLDKEEDSSSTRTELSKIKNRALGMLNDLFDSDQSKLFYVAKVVDGNSAQYRRKTPNDVIYDNMDKFLNGKGVELSVKRAAKAFIDAVGMDMTDLKLKSLIKDATFYQYLIAKGDGTIRHKTSDINLGRNVSECLESLKNPLHDKTMKELMEQVEKHWNN